jgi:HSP20 family protein
MALLPVRRQPEQSSSCWDPTSELKRLQKELTRLVNTWPAFTTFFGDSFAPLAQVTERDDDYLVELQLPEVDERDVEVTIGGRRLSVRGTRREVRRRVPWRRSGRVGHFDYEVVLPGAVEEDGVTATLDEDVLTVRAPKPDTERRRRIEVQ